MLIPTTTYAVKTRYSPFGCKFTKLFHCNVYLNVFIVRMPSNTIPLETYQRQVDAYTEKLKRLKRKRSSLGWLRLIIVLAILLLIYYLFFNAAIFVWTAVIIAIAIFLYVVSVDSNNNETISNLERLRAINQEEISILNGIYYHREDGLSYLPHEHPYAADIDLFGTASV